MATATRLPQTTHFINSVIAKLSACTTSAQVVENEHHQTQTQHHGHPRLAHSQPASPFPASQVPDLRPLMLTLHCIFPNEFLLALDILDRGLVRRVRTRYGAESSEEDESHEQNASPMAGSPSTQPEWLDTKIRKEDFFFVTSASTNQSTPRPSFPATQSEDHHHHMHQQKRWQDKGYEVRLQAWNCTCPPFTMSAFRDLGPEPSSPPSSSSSSLSEDNSNSNIDDEDNPTMDPIGPANDKIDADTSGTNAHATAYSFGGTLPLHPESAPPVCKHILACLLAALCPSLGGGGGEERFITLDAEEIAALCAGWGG